MEIGHNESHLLEGDAGFRLRKTGVRESLSSDTIHNWNFCVNQLNIQFYEFTGRYPLKLYRQGCLTHYFICLMELLNFFRFGYRWTLGRCTDNIFCLVFFFWPVFVPVQIPLVVSLQLFTGLNLPSDMTFMGTPINGMVILLVFGAFLLLQLIFLKLIWKARTIHQENLRKERDLYKYSIRFDELCEEANLVNEIYTLDAFLDLNFTSRQTSTFRSSDFQLKLQQLKKLKVTGSSSVRIMFYCAEFIELVDAIKWRSALQLCLFVFLTFCYIAFCAMFALGIDTDENGNVIPK
jgi:hypothetical protein